MPKGIGNPTGPRLPLTPVFSVNINIPSVLYSNLALEAGSDRQPYIYQLCNDIGGCLLRSPLETRFTINTVV